MTKTLIIKNLTRQTNEGIGETLVFKPGVNVITGAPNAGKTKWLNMLDYLFGDTSKPEEAFGSDLEEKYMNIRADVDIDGEEIQIERRWKEAGQKGKVLVNGEPYYTKD